MKLPEHQKCRAAYLCYTIIKSRVIIMLYGHPIVNWQNTCSKATCILWMSRHQIAQIISVDAHIRYGLPGTSNIAIRKCYTSLLALQ